MTYCMDEQFYFTLKEIATQLPPPDPNTLFAALLQDVPPEIIDMTYECKAFTRYHGAAAQPSTD